MREVSCHMDRISTRGISPGWLGVVLGGAALLIVVLRDVPREADAQVAGLSGSRGVYAFAGQLDRTTFGVIMLDVDEGTIWCYDFPADDDERRSIRLFAARGFEYDRFLKNFNNRAPTSSEVRQLLAVQRNSVTESGNRIDQIEPELDPTPSPP